MALIWLSKSSDDSDSVLDAESGLNDERGKQNLERQAEHENANSGDVVLEKEALGRRHLDEALQSDSANLSSKTGQKTDSQEEDMLDVTHQLVTSLTEEYRREQAAQQKQSNVSIGNKSEQIPYLSTEPQPNLSEVEEEVLNLKNRRSHPEELQKSFDVLSKVVEKSLFDNHWVLSDSEENDLNDALDAATLHASLQGYEVHAECGPIPNMRFPAAEVIRPGWENFTVSPQRCCEQCLYHEAKGYRKRCNGWAYCGHYDCGASHGECWLLYQRSPSKLKMSEFDSSWISGMVTWA